MENNDNKKELEVMNFLSKGDKFVFYVFKKASKISYAIYVITDLIKDTEPLKWTLRKSATEMSALRNFFDEKSVFNNLEKTLLELEAFLDLASFAKVVSEMNSTLLQDEIRRLISDMRARAKEGFYSPQLVPGFFDIPKPEAFSIAPVSPHTKPEDYSKGHKGQVKNYDFYKKPERAEDVKKEFKTTLPNIAKITTEQPKGHRRVEIIAIIKEKSGAPISIKDISDKIKDCSEKTIQRELTSMVEDGTLKKTGERRWSTYSLK
ncbi:MAG: seg [Candidatus Taylorbacteria bacterium]|nr:seg [Candidatus Taylorbacteria bacterium]